MSELAIRITLLAIFTLILNLPFGYWRASVKKKSAQWFLAIHIAVAVIIGLRFLLKVGFVWYSYPIVVVAFFLGQLFGGYIYKYYQKRKNKN